MAVARFDPAQASGDELRRSYVESGYVLVTDLVDEADRAEIGRELRKINRGDYSRSQRYAHDLPDVDSNPVARGFDETGAVPIEMPAGSVLFFSGYLLHSSHQNRSDRYRPALTFHYCSASTWLTWGGEQNFRGVVQVRGEDPLCRSGIHHAAALGEGRHAGTWLR